MKHKRTIKKPKCTKQEKLKLVQYVKSGKKFNQIKELVTCKDSTIYTYIEAYTHKYKTAMEVFADKDSGKSHAKKFPRKLQYR